MTTGSKPTEQSGPRRRQLSGIREVARLAGVSVGTVSNVLNNPALVSEATQLRVKAIIDKIGFVPNRSAVALRYGRSRMLGLVVPDITNPIYAQVAQGATAAAGEQGFVVVLCNTDDEAASETRYLSVLEEQRAAGVLFVPSRQTPDRLLELRHRGTPVVFIDRALSKSEGCSASNDDVYGGRMAVAHLIERGAEHIALINGPTSVRPCADRRRGARQAIKQSGLAPADLEEFVVPEMTVAGGVGAAQSIIEHTGPIDAIFCGNDRLAVGVISELGRRGVRVPDDVLVVGYDDIETASTAPLPVTTVSQPKYELGRTAADLLLREVASGTDPHRHERVVFRPELIVRESTERTARG